MGTGGVFFSFCPTWHLSLPELANVGASLWMVRKSGLETNWSFHSWPFPSTWIKHRIRSLMFRCNKGGFIGDCLLGIGGGVSFPKNCLCSVTEDKPGDSIAAGPQGSPKRHRNCPNCGWPCTPLSAFTALVKGCRGLYSIDYNLWFILPGGPWSGWASWGHKRKGTVGTMGKRNQGS